MARYKPKSTVAKTVANTTEVRKTADEKRWEIGMVKLPDKVLPGIALGDGDKVVELDSFALRREATAALDELLEAIDSLDPAAIAQVPTERAIGLALEALTDRIVA
jgi:hypothetical protein